MGHGHVPRSPRVIIADRPPAEQSCISRALVAAQTVSACANDRVNRPVDRPLSLYEARNAGIGRHYTRGYNQTLPRTSHAAIRRHVERDPTGATPAILIAHRTAAYITATLRARHTASDYSLQFFWQRPTTYGRAVSRRAATPRFCCLVTPCRQNLSHVAFTLGTPLRDPLPLWPMNKSLKTVFRTADGQGSIAAEPAQDAPLPSRCDCTSLDEDRTANPTNASAILDFYLLKVRRLFYSTWSR